MKNKFILIGGSGFIGKSFRNFLEFENEDFISLSSADCNLLDIKNSEKINQLSAINNAIIIFFSALTPDKGKDINTFKKNIKMANFFLENFVINKSINNHIIYISSDAVYPMTVENIQIDTTPSPTDLYSSMHLTREIMFKNKFINNLTILRLTLIYGFGDTHNSYGPNRFFQQMIKDRIINIFGEGSDVRDHLYINDLLKLLYLFANNKLKGTFNLASGNSISYKDLASKFLELFPNSLNKINRIPVYNSITKRYFNISDINKNFNFSFSDIDKNLSEYYNLIIKN